MSGHHVHHDSERAVPRAWRPALAVLVPAAVIVLAGLILLWPDDRPRAEQPDGAQQVTGVVTLVDREPCPEVPSGEPGPPGNGVCGDALVHLTSGPQEGEEAFVDLPQGPGAPTVEVGDDVVLMYLPDTVEGEPYQLVDHQRGSQLWMLAAAFALAVVAFGRLRGLTALAGLGLTFVVLLWFIVPAILAGEPPLLVAIVGSAAIMLTVLYLTHGFATSTSVAVVGTLASLTLTGVLSAVAVSAAHLTGIADEQSSYLGIAHNVNMQGLLLAAILIGSLGVLDDVTVTQSVTVAELARANPGYGFTDLYRAATRIGRSHIASVINTIILAYAGASLPLLILIAAVERPLGETLTNQLIAQEIVRSAVGTIGLIAAVPITTALAAWAVRRERTQARPRAGNHVAAEETFSALSGERGADPDRPSGHSGWSTADHWR